MGQLTGMCVLPDIWSHRKYRDPAGGVTKVEAESDEEQVEGSQLGEAQVKSVTPSGEQDSHSSAAQWRYLAI